MSLSPVHEVAPSSLPLRIAGDEPLRRRIFGELNEIRRELDRTEPSPIAEVLLTWYDHFTEQLNERRAHASLSQVVERFAHVLEEILQDPLHPERPYSPELFGEAPSPLVQLLVRKMRDRHSLLFSERIESAAPVAIDRDRLRLVEQMRRIGAVRATRQREERESLESAQALGRRLSQVRRDQADRLSDIARRAGEELRPLAEEIVQLREDISSERIARLSHDLRQEVIQLRQDIVHLREETEDVRREMDAVSRAEKELQISIAEVSAAAKEKKDNWLGSLLKIAASIAATWVMSKIAPGVTITFS